MGGLGDNKAYQDYLEQRLGELSRTAGYKISLIKPPQKYVVNDTTLVRADADAGRSGRCATAVAVGAVLRASDKRNGPPRRLQSSYGIVRREKWSTKFPGHREVEGVLDANDNKKYVHDTIYWAFKKVKPRC